MNEPVVEKPLSRHVPVPDVDVRLRKIWSSVSTRLDAAPALQAGQRHGRWPWPAFVVAAAGAVAGLWFLLGPEADPGAAPFERARLETASDRLRVDLQDGSRIELAKRTRVSVTEAVQSSVEVVLEQGRVDCDVVPNATRRFSVVAQGLEVRVTGTRFSVELLDAGRRVEVDVARGSVEVRRPGEEEPLRRLLQGERWSLEVAPERAAALGVADGPATAAEPSPTEPPAGAGSQVVAETSEPDANAAGSSVARELSEPSASAKQLLERGNDARRQGNARAAAAAYEELLRLHPSDGRAGLAAFELGRLRMDRLGDLGGAVTALKRAVALGAGSAFREDALARLVGAYQAQGQGGACRTARKAYLAEYPAGVHAAKVSRSCTAN